MKSNRLNRSLKNTDKDLAQKQDFYKSLKIGIESFQTFIRRFESTGS